MLNVGRCLCREVRLLSHLGWDALSCGARREFFQLYKEINLRKGVQMKIELSALFIRSYCIHGKGAGRPPRTMTSQPGLALKLE